jgi:hypothetical protein
MKLGDEIVYMSLPDKAMLCVPNIYREMLKSLKLTHAVSLEMPVPSQGHYGFHSFPVVD